MIAKQVRVVPPRNLYWEAVIDFLPRTLEPALTLWLFQNGCWGTQEKLDFEQPDLRYLPQVKSKRMIHLSAYFDVAAKEKVEGHLLHWLSRRAPMARVLWNLQATRDWLSEWKKHFKPFTLAGLKIVPVWLSRKKQRVSKNTILVEPGMAFGTGTHATTRFAVEMLKKIAPKLRGRSLLDVGAGSGILSVAAEKFGASSCVAIDIDPESWRECRKMFKLNACKKCRVTKRQLSDVKANYEVVVANIIDGVLMDLKNDLFRVTKPGGCLILSGILTDGAKIFAQNFIEGTGARVIGEFSDREWTSLLISK